MQSNFVQAGPVRLQYLESGPKRQPSETVVLVHGYASNALIWCYTIEKLADNGGFRVIALNNRGAGDSDRTELEGDYSVESFGVDLLNAVDALGFSRFTLVGHSMGGATATQFALAHQDRLNALVLLNSAPLNGRPLAPDWEGQLREFVASGRQTDGDMGFDAPHVTQEFKDEVTGVIRRNPVERAIGGRRSMSALRLRNRLEEIRVPTLIVGGDRDTTVGVDNIVAEYFALPEEVRHLQIFHNIGHSPNVAVPGEFAGLVAQFVGEVSAAEGVG